MKTIKHVGKIIDTEIFMLFAMTLSVFTLSVFGIFTAAGII
jgi:hypothetical protein